jgi:hypothetical protein
MKNEPATKNDVLGIKNNILELKDSILDLKQGLESKIDDTKQSLEVTEWRMTRLEDRMSDHQEENKRDFNTLFRIMDGLARNFTDANIEKASFNSALYRHEDKLDNHEARISALENDETSFQPIKS